MVSDKSGTRFLLSKRPQYFLKLRPGGHIPKSGILLCKYLDKAARNKRVLDIGTGEGAILAISAAKAGALSVVGTDIENSAIRWAKKNVRFNNLSNIRILKSDIFSKISSRFDILVSNPPQMPMLSGPLHDSGGRDGRRELLKIIRGASTRLSKDGYLLLLIFDFLGVDKSYGSQPSLREILSHYGFRMKILGRYRRMVRKEGKTAQSLDHILSIYPKFRFQQKEGQLRHYVFVVRARKITP